MNREQLRVSVVEPITPAIERVKMMLFKPFDMGKWFVIGFCAWLAELGKPQSSGFQGNFSQPFQEERLDLQNIMDEMMELLDKALEFLGANLYWIVPIAVIVIIISVLLVWLSSRGRFMFLNCVVKNQAEIETPWKRFKSHADSLFLFRLVLGLFTLIITAVAIYVGILIFSGAAMSGSLWGAGITAIAAFFFMAVLGIVLSLIKKFTTDFVVPIMFLRTSNCLEAWREFLVVLSANKGRFALYILFQLVIGFAIGISVLILGCVTCCCATCLLSIPYLGTVLLLPVFIFYRSYSLYYIRQYGPLYAVFEKEEPTISTETF